MRIAGGVRRVEAGVGNRVQRPDPEPGAAGLPTSEAVARVLNAPRAALVEWPSPLDEINHPTLGRVLVKRDDFVGFGGLARSGVKARKLEGLFGFMLERGIGKVSVPLGNITNLGAPLIHHARQLGIDVEILVVNRPRIPQARREEIFGPLAGSVRLMDASHVSAFVQLLATASADALRGKRTLITAPSPAHPSAIVGAARGYIEAVTQCWQQHGCFPRSLYIASAAGSTAAGFGLGEALMRAAGAPAVEIVAVQVVPEPIRLWLDWFVFRARRHLKIAGAVKTNFNVVAERRNLRYGRFDRDHVAVCARVEQLFGLTIDPIYGGKAWSVMEAREASVTAARPVLFWHCGYTPNWMNYGSEEAAEATPPGARVLSGPP